MYHYLSAVQLMSIETSILRALMPYTLSGVVGMVVGVLFPDINSLIPLVTLLAFSFNRQQIRPSQ